MSEKSHKKYQHETLVVLLDDCFCNDDVAGALTAAGYVLEQFNTHFPRNPLRPTVREQGVKDPKVLALSHRNKWVILTTDNHMREKHREEFLRYSEAMVVATAHKEGGDEVWSNAFIKAKARIKRLHKKQPRPWCAQINQQGYITVCKTMDCAEIEKRKRKKS